MTFGLYPALSLARARELRFSARQLIAAGKDPIFERREQERVLRYNSSNIFSSIAKEWHDLNKDRWTDKYSRKVWNRLENYVFPIIGNRNISELNGLEILEIIRKIEGQGKTETSHKLLGNCSSIFRLAFLTRRISYNPLADLKGVLKPHKVKHFPAVKINELPEFIRKLEESKASAINKLAVKMLILTFVRQGELRKAKWEHFDFEKKMWFIPAELMKMRKEHIVPLAGQAIQLLQKIKCLSGSSEYLFPSCIHSKYPYMNENVMNKLIHNLGYKDRLVAHGFRSIASTTLNELGFSPDIIEKQLAHSERNQVRAAYNRAEYLAQRVEMMQKWADYISSLKK